MCVRMCVARFFLCDTHSQLDAYFIIRFQRRQTKANHQHFESIELPSVVPISFYLFGDIVVCVCRAYGFLGFSPSCFFTSRQCVKFGFYRFLFNIRIRLRRCNDGIMMIVAKMAKDLKCDNVCVCRCRRFCIDCFSATIVMLRLSHPRIKHTHMKWHTRKHTRNTDDRNESK